MKKGCARFLSEIILFLLFICCSSSKETLGHINSGGFFDDMTNEVYERLRRITCFENLDRVQNFVDKGEDSIKHMRTYNDKYFWQQNYEPVYRFFLSPYD